MNETSSAVSGVEFSLILAACQGGREFPNETVIDAFLRPDNRFTVEMSIRQKFKDVADKATLSRVQKRPVDSSVSPEDFPARDKGVYGVVKNQLRECFVLVKRL